MNIHSHFLQQMWNRLDVQRADLPDSIDVTLRSMDDPEALSPEDHAWTESQLSWISLGDELPAYRRERKLE